MTFDAIANKANQNFAELNLEEKYKKNPISNEGRIAILRGCLENYNLSLLSQSLNMPIILIFSKHNTFVNIYHVEHFLRHENLNRDKIKKYIDLRGIIKLKIPRYAYLNYEGGYNFYEVLNL